MQCQQPVRVIDDGYLIPPLTPVSRVRLICYLYHTVTSPLLSELTCGFIAAPSSGSVDISGTLPFSLGSQVTYRCDEGLFPPDVRTSTCTDVEGSGEWVENPGSLVCRERPGAVKRKRQRFPFPSTVFILCVYSDGAITDIMIIITKSSLGRVQLL